MSTLLPIELIEMQAQALELMSSLYPSEDELKMSSETAQALTQIQGGDMTSVDWTKYGSLEFSLHLSLQSDEDQTEEPSFPIELSIQLPLRRQHGTGSELDPPAPVITLRQPAWLSRTAHEELSKMVHAREAGDGSDEQGVEAVLQYVERLKRIAPQYFPKAQAQVAHVEKDAEWRVWLTLTSLSTREKRDDMVQWAPDHDLTGFVLAGKPALLVLEGTTRNVDAFMSDIKARSWVSLASLR